MYTVEVVRPDGIELRIHTPARDKLGDIIAREQRKGSEIVEVVFPDEQG